MMIDDDDDDDDDDGGDDDDDDDNNDGDDGNDDDDGHARAHMSLYYTTSYSHNAHRPFALFLPALGVGPRQARWRTTAPCRLMRHPGNNNKINVKVSTSYKRRVTRQGRTSAAQFYPQIPSGVS
jgi:hypothetical protein